MDDKAFAKGRTADIYLWGDRQILKLYHQDGSLGAAEYEATVTQKMRDLGLPVPRVGEVKEINGRTGLIFDRCQGCNLGASLSYKPWTAFQGAQILAKLHAEIGNKSIPDLPSQKEWLTNRIETATALPEKSRYATIDLLRAQEAGEKICHGDFHPGNILLTPEKPIVIDWPLVTRGNPMGDIALTSLLLTAAAPLSNSATQLLNLAPLKMMRQWFCNLYLRAYSNYRKIDFASFSNWSAIAAAARLADNIPGENKTLTEIVLSAFSHDKISKHRHPLRNELNYVDIKNK